jgi:Zn-dependent peptidase ImmA (M78 family)
LGSLAELLGARVVSVDLAPTVFGAIVDIGGTRGISINSKLAGAGYAGTLGHELGHAIQPGTVAAFCSTTLAASAREREAHVLASVFTVPFSAIAAIPLWSDEPGPIADSLGVPRPYVHMRLALSVVLGERSGDVRAARALLNGALLAHQLWMKTLSDELRRQHPPGAVT